MKMNSEDLEKDQRQNSSDETQDKQRLELNKQKWKHRHITSINIENHNIDIIVPWKLLFKKKLIQKHNFNNIVSLQEAQLSQRDVVMLRVIEYFAKSLKIIQNDTVE